MTANEYLALGETVERYELIEGVVVMSPSPFANHNEIAHEIDYQLGAFARSGGAVRVFPETDIRLSNTKVYRPDLAVYRSERLRGKVLRLETPPDLVIEILSPGSKPLDLITKRDDYDRFGVAEYWVLDPADASVRCWRRRGTRMTEAPIEGSVVPCEALPGFALDLGPIRSIAQQE